MPLKSGKKNKNERKLKIMTIRSKHNNLLNYFLYDEKDLSKAYVRKCKNFIDNIRAEVHIESLKELKKQMENK